jgi:hypothetical protein
VIVQPWLRKPIVAKTGRSLADSLARARGDGSSQPVAPAAATPFRKQRREVGRDVDMGGRPFGEKEGSCAENSAADSPSTITQNNRRWNLAPRKRARTRKRDRSGAEKRGQKSRTGAILQGATKSFGRFHSPLALVVVHEHPQREYRIVRPGRRDSFRLLPFPRPIQL